jgi:polar amino acid transport system substrate-binding protein
VAPVLAQGTAIERLPPAGSPLDLDNATTSDPATPVPARTVLRFLTDTDYPPFNYYDEEGTLTGFNVDFARAVCFELELGCDIATAEWKGLLPGLQRGEADAVIASIGTTSANLAQADFTTGYYVMAGRFVARKAQVKIEITPINIESQRVGVLKGSAHEAYLQTFFRDIVVVPFDNEEAARAALAKSEVDYLFGDGIGLMFWINGASAAACCEFRGGAFYDPRYFGDGVGIAVRKGDTDLRALLDKGIAKVRASGRYEELLQRYFPFKLF